MDGDEAKTLPNDHVFDVIIVGAGWAGIAAGKQRFFIDTRMD
jgi:ribulose 1,5-bisphosphate synthetase/thiazole synthase